MTVHELNPELLWFHHSPRNNQSYGFSQYAMLSGKRAFLLDTGYNVQFVSTQNWLAERNFQIESILISHFHLDHYEGLQSFSHGEVYGSRLYKETLSRFRRTAQTLGDRPDKRLSTGDHFRFGNSEILVFETPGHSSCSLVSCINQNTFHVGDLVLFAEDGSPILPLLQKGGLDDHIASLEFLRHQEIHMLLPAHGDPIHDSTRIENELALRLNYLYYLKTAQDSPLNPSEDQTLTRLLQPFKNGDWHRHNRRALGKLPE